MAGSIPLEFPVELPVPVPEPVPEPDPEPEPEPEPELDDDPDELLTCDEEVLPPPPQEARTSIEINNIDPNFLRWSFYFLRCRFFCAFQISRNFPGLYTLILNEFFDFEK